MVPHKLERSMSMVKRQFHFRKPLCPFISSTFQDFQAERDILMKKVFPAVDALCRERGTYCAPCDLRWGINASQANSGLIIHLCLNYVLKTAPFFICLLGERYGSHRSPDAPPLPESYADLGNDADWLDKSLLVAASGGHDWVLQYQHCSVTELEIIQAAFRGETDEFCYFYCRQPDHIDLLYTDLPDEERQEKICMFHSESDYSAQRVKELKAKITKKGLRIKYFKYPEDLAQIVLKDWTELVERLFPPLENMLSETYTERFVEWMAHESFAETRRRVFIQSEQITKLFVEITQFAITAIDTPQTEVFHPANPEEKLRKKSSEGEVIKSILTLVSDRGCGKTSVMANWVEHFSQEYPDIKVLSHYVGSSALSTDVTALMRRVAMEMRGEFQDATEESDITSTCEDMTDFYHLSETFIASLSLGPCVIIIDGIDELSGSYGLNRQQVKELSWLPQPLPPQCKIILSTSRSDATHKTLNQRSDTVTYTMPLIAEEQHKKEVMSRHLVMHCKSLNEDQLSRIVTHKLSDKPIFLSILANELRVFGVYTRLDYHLDSYLEATSVRDLWGRIIHRWIKDYSWTMDEESSDASGSQKDTEFSGWVADALGLLAVSRNGLSVPEILDLLSQLGYHGNMQVTAVDWASFRSAATDALFERPGGLLCFFHQHFREAVEYNLLGLVKSPSVSNFESSHQTVHIVQVRDGLRIKYHRHLAEYFMNMPHSQRRTDELPWQLKLAGDFEGMVKVLSEPRIFMELHCDLQIHSRKLDLLAYWKLLSQEGYVASDIYLQMLKTTENLNETTDHENKDSSKVLSWTEQLNLCRTVGQFLSESGQFEHAEEVLLDAHKRMQNNYPLDEAQQELLCGIEESLANLNLYKLNMDQAKKWYNRALTTLTTLVDSLQEAGDIRKHTESKGRLLDKIGNMLTHEHNYKKAESTLMKAKFCMQSAGSVTGKATVQYHIGILRMFQKQFGEAEACFRQAVAIRERWFGKSHPLVAEVLNDLAGLLCHQNNLESCNYDEAESLFRRALRIRENCLGPTHLLVATTLFHLGRLLKTYKTKQGTKEAILHLHRSLDIRTAILGSDHHITKAVQRALNLAEASLHYRPNRSRSSSMEKQPGSRASWSHDTRQPRHRTQWQEDSQGHRGRDISAERPRSWQENHSKGFRSERLRSNQSPLRSKVDKYYQSHSNQFSNHQNHRSENLYTHQQNQRDSRSHRWKHQRPTRSEEFHRTPKYMDHMSQHKPQDGSNHDFRSHGQCAPDPVTNNLKLQELNADSLNNANIKEMAISDNYLSNPVRKKAVVSVKDLLDEKTNDECIHKVPKPQRTPRKQTRDIPSSKKDSYLDSFASEDRKSQFSQSKNNLQEEQKNHRLDTGILHSNSMPLLQKNPHESALRRHNSAPVSLNRIVTPKISYNLHNQNCYIPGPHTLDVHNVFSPVVGPNSSVQSLTGFPPCPRDLSLGIQHTSAWYHVPGRYKVSNSANLPCYIMLHPNTVLHTAENPAKLQGHDVQNLTNNQ